MIAVATTVKVESCGAPRCRIQGYRWKTRYARVLWPDWLFVGQAYVSNSLIFRLCVSGRTRSKLACCRKRELSTVSKKFAPKF